MSPPDAAGLRTPIAIEQADFRGSPGSEISVLALIDHFVLGGAEMLLSQFAAAAPSAGIRLSVACLFELDGNPAAEPLRDLGLVPVNLDSPKPFSPKSVRAVRQHISDLSPDIVHTHLGGADVVGSLAARSLGVPVVSTIHTALWSHHVRTYVKRGVVRLCADRVIAVSDSARRSYEKRGFAGKDQTVTIHNGVDVAAMPGSGRALRHELGWREDDLVLGMVSALRAVKGHDIAIAAFRQLIDEFPTLKLLIVGRGREWDEIKRMTSDLGGSVAMIGHRFDVMRCFDAFDVCVHPSEIEAFPTTLIEAMAASVPVVATAVGGIPEIVDDGRTGVLVPAPPTAERVTEALRPLLRDQLRRQALAKAARRAYEEQFTSGPWIRSTRALYDEVLAEKRNRVGHVPSQAAAANHDRSRNA